MKNFSAMKSQTTSMYSLKMALAAVTFLALPLASQAQLQITTAVMDSQTINTRHSPPSRLSSLEQQLAQKPGDSDAVTYRIISASGNNHLNTDDVIYN
jgi:multiple stress resistance protein BhsA